VSRRGRSDADGGRRTGGRGRLRGTGRLRRRGFIQLLAAGGEPELAGRAELLELEPELLDPLARPFGALVELGVRILVEPVPQLELLQIEFDLPLLGREPGELFVEERDRARRLDPQRPGTAIDVGDPGRVVFANAPIDRRRNLRASGL